VTAEAAYAHEASNCSDFGRKFLSSGGLARHRRKHFCPKFEEVAAKRRLMLHVFSCWWCQAPLLRRSAWRVSPVNASAVSGLAELSARVVADYTVTVFSTGDPSSIGDLGFEIQAGSSVVMELRRSPLSIPGHGSTPKKSVSRPILRCLSLSESGSKNVYKNRLERMHPKMA
jgi:hypothetical protein